MLISTYYVKPPKRVHIMSHHPVVSHDEWVRARRMLLLKEKQATHLRDEINAERLALPWVRIDRDYIFDTVDGRKTLAELFGDRTQLMIYHFMLGPGWGAGCPGCSFLVDHLDGALPHLEHHDVTMVAVSRAPLAEIQAYKTRMGWRFPWVSSSGGRHGCVQLRFPPDARCGQRHGVAWPQRLLQG
jgi:predicted dithiol-disulfide oxidoreductase (DUF899 family)